MVHVYNCHPFSSQQIVQVEQEPGLVCCGGGALFVVASGGCKVVRTVLFSLPTSGFMSQNNKWKIFNKASWKCGKK
ncbi:unnamed protein product [Tetraodon nigroviridis]|uniref:(spotted green pufferfish) hypothetical protein n=1 Tax=Tetraodon nigroviridis TaxID=99883 RepID=Q4S6Q8_TETNG|nr:unnamed protein product [Tetraodon nigroviridis]